MGEIAKRIDCDVLVVGGGINGAGIARDAAGRGLSVVLCEKDDLAQHTSSASSKLIHGGLRYLEQYHFGLVRKALAEREVLLKSAPHIIHPLRFLMPHAPGQRPAWMIRAGLFLYDHLAPRDFLPASGAVALRATPAGAALQPQFVRGFAYSDAWVDDARLVVLAALDAREHGATVLTRTRCVRVRRDATRWDAELHGADGVIHVHARCLVNAAGPWAGSLLHDTGAGPARPMRLVKGSHIVVPRLFDGPDAFLLQQPDGRIVFALPYEGAFTLVGTTDLDHEDGMEREPHITRAEVDYLMAALQAQFPQLQLTDDDVVSTYAGVRPVIAGKEGGAPSQEGREHAVWSSDGLVAIAGGKLTTFRAIALDALRLVKHQLPGWDDPLDACPVFAPIPLPVVPDDVDVDAGMLRRLHGRYGACAAALIDAARPGELERIPGTETAWAELRWAARSEAVRHLDDLLLRRTRLGLLLRDGGAAHLPRIRAICQPELGWDDVHWAREEAAYRTHWTLHHGLPHDD